LISVASFAPARQITIVRHKIANSAVIFLRSAVDHPGNQGASALC
jgi:hypothetical protein